MKKSKAFQPVEEPETSYCVVVTGISQHPPISFLDDFSLAKTKDIALKPPCTEKALKGTKKCLEFEGTEVDVRSGNIVPTPVVGEKDVKQKKPSFGMVAQDEISINTAQDLNIQLRQDAWQQAIIKNGKVSKGDNLLGIRPESYVMPESFPQIGFWKDNFSDFAHLDKHVHDTYVEGCVVRGTHNAVMKLLNAGSNLQDGTHGVIVDMEMSLSHDGLYKESIHYTTVKKLGSGSFGSVSLCRNYGGKEYVKKTISDRFKRTEVEILMQLSHPNIISFFGYIVHYASHEILMEYGGDSLKTFMSKNKTMFKELLSDEVVGAMAIQGFSGLKYMHEKFGILHLDIKPENLLVSFGPPVLKLTDFGTSKSFQQEISFEGWTPEYMSPEACALVILSQKPPSHSLTPKVDVFAFALTICYMLTGNHAVSALWPPDFKVEMLGEFRTNFMKHLALNPSFMQQLAVKDDWKVEIRELVFRCLEGDPKKRFSADEACQFIHKYMAVFVPDVSLRSAQQVEQAVEQMEFDCPASPMDVSLQHNRPVGGGKDIKNQLRQMIRRKSTGPYSRKVAKPKEKSNIMDQGQKNTLPIFDMLLD